MKAVFDTNILIDYLNGLEEARKELEGYQTRVISVITSIEVLVGTKPEDDFLVRKFLSAFRVIHVNNEVADISIDLRRSKRLKVPDAIVYATAKHEGCLLVTRNTKDIKRKWADVRVPYTLK